MSFAAFLLAASLAATTTAAAVFSPSTFSFTEKKVDFVTDASRKLTVSASCLKNKKLECEAVAGLKKLSWKASRESRRSGTNNPASYLCEKQLGGFVVVGKSEKGDENSFCRFNDGSMIDGGSLIYRARKND
jgi:putative hemolysin